MEFVIDAVLSMVILRLFGVNVFSEDAEATKIVCAAGGIIAASSLWQLFVDNLI